MAAILTCLCSQQKIQINFGLCIISKWYLCSQYFVIMDFALNNDIYIENLDSPEEREDLFACRVCLATDIKLFDIHECDLAENFEAVMGVSVSIRRYFLCRLILQLLINLKTVSGDPVTRFASLRQSEHDFSLKALLV